MPSSLAGLIYQHDEVGDFDLGPLMDRTREREWTPLDLAEYFQSLDPDEGALVQGQISSMGLDGYEVCLVYRYNTQLNRYEYSSIAPVYFSDPGYFRSTQVVPYMEDLGGGMVGRRSR